MRNEQRTSAIISLGYSFGWTCANFGISRHDFQIRFNNDRESKLFEDGFGLAVEDAVRMRSGGSE